MSKEVYTLGVKCDNCKARGEITIAKGVRPEELACKECGIKAIAEFPTMFGFTFGDRNFKETYYADAPNGEEELKSPTLDKLLYDVPLTKRGLEKRLTEAKTEVLEEVLKEMGEIIERWEDRVTSPRFAPMYSEALRVLQEFKGFYLTLENKKNE